MTEGQPAPSPDAEGRAATGAPRHMAVRSRSRLLSAPVLVAAAVVVLAAGGSAVAVAATSGPTKAQREAAAAAAAAKRAAEARALAQHQIEQLAAQLSLTPAPGATGVPLDGVVKVVATAATVDSLTVADSAGAVPGTFAAATGVWTPTSGLAAATAYTVSIVLAANGVTATRTSTFTTLTPTATASATVYPRSGSTVGVGQPIEIDFSRPIDSPAARAAIVSRLSVAMTHPAPGGWYWFSNDVLHFRPQNFWAADQSVQVSGNLDGIDLGKGVWTAGNVLDTFAVGDARISYANLQRDVMTVTRNGATLYTFPISGGSTQYPTMNGIHLVLDKEPVVHMVSSTVGIPVKSPNGYDEYVYDDVHISMSGEYVHAAPWSVYAQGVTNVSHGCINVSKGNAQTFYNFSDVGDIVEVTGSPRPAVTWDGGVRDWSGPAWSQWTAAHVTQIGAGRSTAGASPATAPAGTAPPATAASPASPPRPTTATTVAATTSTTVKTTTTTAKPPKTTSTTRPSTTTTTRHA